MATKKNIKIQVWTDLYYAKFIAIWRPEEEEGYEPPEPDTRTEQEKNVPFLLVTNSMYKGRKEVVGENPVTPSQHPMPTEFLKQQIRHISYMFANEFGIFQPPTKAHANTFLAKQKVGFTLVKEMNATVTPAQGSISLKEFRDSLMNYTDEELRKIQVMTVGQHPEDAYGRELDEFIYTPHNMETEQYISITRLVNVYDVVDPYINNSTLDSENLADSYAPGTETADATLEQIALSEEAVATNEAELATMQTAEAMPDPMEASTAVTEEIVEPTKEEVQQQTIKDLQAKIAELEAQTPGSV